ncbi:MAG: hypothetical protein ACYS5V_13320, partial [Planctomycetota bacterium]
MRDCTRVGVLVVLTAAMTAWAGEEVERWTPAGGRSEKMFDRATLVRAWDAPDLPGPAERRTEITPAVRDRRGKLTGRAAAAAPVVSCSAGQPAMELDFGTLDVGLYVVRVIAAADTKDIQQYRKPIYVELKVRNRPDGQSHFRHRIAYWDAFYAVTELYFNVDARQACPATLAVGAGSAADLYVHRVELHNVLAGLAGKAGKTLPALFTYPQRESLRATAGREEVVRTVRRHAGLDKHLQSTDPALSGERRRQRDELLWNAAPPINSQYIAEYDEGFAVNAMRPGKTSPEAFRQEHGKWELPAHMSYAWHTPLVFVNRKLNLRYTREDLAAHRPLPEPYPFRDAIGAYVPKAEGMAHAEHWMPISALNGLWWEGARLPLAPYHGDDMTHRLPYLYHALGDRRAARDAALLLCKWAYLYPSLTEAQMLGFAVIAPAGRYHRDSRLLQNRFGYMRTYNLLLGLVHSYDYLFDYIRGNDELAEAVGRFVPWVKTDRDVRRLIETRVLQYGARQIMRFHRWNDKGTPNFLMTVAAVQQDPKITRPWMDYLWSRTYVYPYRRAGLPEYLSTTTQRDGTTTIGSVFYTWGGTPFLRTVALSRQYVANGGDARFDLSDFRRYRKVMAACAFPLDSTVAGGFPMTIGDVGAP